MRDINNFRGDVGQQETTVCNLAALQIAARYTNILSAQLANAEREGLTSFTLDVQEISLLAAELIQSNDIAPDDANICYTVRMAMRIIAKNRHQSFDMASVRTDEGYVLALTLRA
jgi:hypothetical protein